MLGKNWVNGYQSRKKNQKDTTEKLQACLIGVALSEHLSAAKWRIRCYFQFLDHDFDQDCPNMYNIQYKQSIGNEQMKSKRKIKHGVVDVSVPS